MGSASIQAMTSSASRAVSSTPSARATAAHSCASARATSRTSSRAKISAGRPASAITPETALAHSLRQASQRERAADGDLGVVAQQRREALPRRPARDGEAQGVALAHAARRRPARPGTS